MSDDPKNNDLDDEKHDKFTLHRGDLRLTKPGTLNPGNRSFTMVDGRPVFYDDEEPSDEGEE